MQAQISSRGLTEQRALDVRVSANLGHINPTPTPGATFKGGALRLYACTGRRLYTSTSTSHHLQVHLQCCHLRMDMLH